jgi:hypothetical protein
MLDGMPSRSVPGGPAGGGAVTDDPPDETDPQRRYELIAADIRAAIPDGTLPGGPDWENDHDPISTPRNKLSRFSPINQPSAASAAPATIAQDHKDPLPWATSRAAGLGRSGTEGVEPLTPTLLPAGPVIGSWTARCGARAAVRPEGDARRPGRLPGGNRVSVTVGAAARHRA